MAHFLRTLDPELEPRLRKPQVGDLVTYQLREEPRIDAGFKVRLSLMVHDR